VSLTLQSLLDQGCFLAGDEGLNKDVIAETLIPRVIYFTIDSAASDPTRRGLVMVTSTVGLVNGNAALPTTALVHHLQFASVADPLDSTVAKKMRFANSWPEFIRPLDSTLGYFLAVQSSGANQFYYTQPGTAYSPSSGYTGNITLTTPQIPTLPATASTAITVNGEIEQDLVLNVAKAIKGDLWMKQGA